MEKRLIENIIFISLVLILVLAVAFFIFYFKNQEDICQINPLVYGARQYAEQDHVSTAQGILILGTFPSSEIWFNENNMTFLSQKYKQGMGGFPPSLNKTNFNLTFVND